MLKSFFNFVRPAEVENNGYIFPKVDPEVDGDDCDKDCSNCTIRYPSWFKINNNRPLYGHIKPFTVHVLVATGKTDWVRKVQNDKGSLTEAFKNSAKPRNERLMVSASDLPTPESDEATEQDPDEPKPTTVLLLPSFTYVDAVTPSDIPELITRFIDSNPDAVSDKLQNPSTDEDESPSPPQPLTRLPPSRPCPHDYVILLCSHRTRDARCGVSAPLIKKELERHLRPLGLYRDRDDERPGGVGIHFVSHIGGHQVSANVIVYRRVEGQMIWLARIKPEHCEGIVKQTILKGKIVNPEERLRGGFDRGRDVTSW
ncbi:hypothetical protein FQN54_002868 [Arachnomyces sp. PD_36]|nr:hypothetical protein FQN54_002868 [Arachnomyces sp. PD_36]